MKVKREEQKVKPQLKLSEEFLDLRTMDNNIIVKHLEENMRIRELPIEKRFKREMEKI
ncbi:MAG: hypothetical protein QXD13_02320 [Candidatus Pacearchaeota archaeon]